MKGCDTQITTKLTPGEQFQGYNKSVDRNESIKEEEFSSKNQDLKAVKRRLEK